MIKYKARAGKLDRSLLELENEKRETLAFDRTSPLNGHGYRRNVPRSLRGQFLSVIYALDARLLMIPCCPD